MTQWDKIVTGVVILALISTVVASKQTSGAITAIGQTFVKLVNNIVGVPAGQKS